MGDGQGGASQTGKLAENSPALHVAGIDVTDKRRKTRR